MARTNLRAKTAVLDLDKPMLWLSKHDPVRLRDLLENAIILAGTGAGKSSGVGKAIRRALLLNGMGGIVMVAKNSEVATWLQDARECGREQSVIVFDEEHCFNFLSHDLAQAGAGGVNEVVENLMRVFSICRTATPDGGRVTESFWQDETRKKLRNILPVLHAATGTIRMEDISDFLVSSPTSDAQLADEEWRRKSSMYQWMLAARMAPKAPLDANSFARIARYWSDEVAQQDNRLRTNTTATVTSLTDRFLHGRLAKCFSGESTIFPELIFQGTIIILAMPTVTWGDDGIIGQQTFLYYAQRLILKRSALPPGGSGRFRQDILPVFIHADEAQEFFNAYTASFLSMSRSALCCSIYLSQSLPTIYAKIGGDNPKYTGDMLLAQFGTKIFGNNLCPETSNFASSLIGRSIQRRANFSQGETTGWSSGVNMGEGTNHGTSSGSSVSTDGKGGTNVSSNPGTSSGYNDKVGRSRGHNSGASTPSGYAEVLDHEVEPSAFSRFRTGGPANGGIVDAIWVQAGRHFQANGGRPWLRASFRQ